MKLSDYLNAQLNRETIKEDQCNLYKHINNRDVAIQIQHLHLRPYKDDVVLTVTWYNVVDLNNIYRIGDDLITIKVVDLPLWEIVDVQAGRILGDNL